MDKQDSLYWKVLAFFEGHLAQIQHLIKVHSFAARIGRRECLARLFPKQEGTI